MITGYDYLSIAFYFCFIAGVGIYFVRRSKNTSDYFRAGGIMPWWVTGASTWMFAFSAWTFTGAAGKMYETGPYVFVGPYYSVVLPLLVLLLFTCYRFRRMGVVTPIEAVRQRYGPGGQQVITWLRLPFMIIFGGVALNAVGVFMAAVFGVPLWMVIIGLGFIVTFLSLLGGSFGVVASDFVQMFLIVTVTVTVAVLALNLPDIGGLGGMLEKAPKAHHNWSEIARPQFIVMFFIAFTLAKLFEENSMDKSAKYLMARSDRDARMTLIIPIVGTILGPLIWLIPPTVAAIRHPEMASIIPNLRFPNEAAFLVTALDVLPQGMLGLLVCGIFAATLTTMDAGLNQGAGIFVRNFYLPVVNPHASEKMLLVLSKAATGFFGLIMVLVGLWFSRFRETGLFDLVNQLAVSLTMPMIIPLSVGLFFKRTPSWSLWTTIAMGLACSFIVKFVLTPEMFTWVPGMSGPFKTEEVTQFYLFGTAVLVTAVCLSWYFFTSLFYAKSPAAHRDAVEEFFERINTPVAARPNEAERENKAIAGSIGKLLLIYGAFVGLLALIPNPLAGRLCFVACGGVMVVFGVFLVRHYRLDKPPLLSGVTAVTTRSN
jgi:SSS family solute:Na+ symporter